MNGMMMEIAAQAVLWLWFLGCVITWRFGKCLLVEGVGVRSAEFAVLCLYSAALAVRWCLPPDGRWFLLTVLILWFAAQFMFHWYYTIFGASEQKLKGYNECFRGTVRLFPASETRLVPDLYHIVLHALILINIIFCLV